MRRLSFLFSAVAIVAALCGGPAAVAAQGATPATQDTMFTDTMGLPELQVSATDTSLEGVPAETPAGRYVVTFSNTTTDPEGAAVHFMQLPEDVSVEALMATPAAEETGSSNWYYEVYQAGGTIALPGQTAQVILDLIPGDYVVWGGFPDLPQAPVEMSVTSDPGATPIADLPEPEANVTVTELNLPEGGFAFEIEGALMPGPNVIRIVNTSDQPHVFFVERYPEPITLAQVQAYLMSELTSDVPAQEMIDGNLLELTVSASTQSAGTTQWLAVNLQPGSHIISCFVEDPTMDDMPHAFGGMIDVVQVGDIATPTH
jgi:hypothetical protein